MNFAFGSPKCAARDLVTGAYSVLASGGINNARYERSKYGIAIQGANGPTFVVDDDFVEGYAIDLNGSSNYLQYTSQVFQNMGSDDFIIEAEIHPTNTSGATQHIVNKNDGNNYTFGFNAGYLYFVCNSSGTKVITCDDKEEPETYHWVMVKKVGTVVSLWRDETGDKTQRTWTEVASYATQPSVGDLSYGDAGDIMIGTNQSAAAAFFEGRIGIVRTAREASDFAYDNFRTQAAIVTPQNMGYDLILGKQVHGNSNFFEGGVSVDRKPFVDSFDQLLSYEKVFGASGKDLAVRVQMNRGDQKLQTGFKGIDFRFKK